MFVLWLKLNINNEGHMSIREIRNRTHIRVESANCIEKNYVPLADTINKRLLLVRWLR